MLCGCSGDTNLRTTSSKKKVNEGIGSRAQVSKIHASPTRDSKEGLGIIERVFSQKALLVETEALCGGRIQLVKCSCMVDASC